MTRHHPAARGATPATVWTSEHELDELVLPLVPAPTADRLARVVQLIGLRPELWQEKVDFDPDSRYYARLGTTDTYEVWLLTWLPGQTTELHDHGDAVGGFTVVAGLLRERQVVDLGGGRHSLRERHLPPGTVRAVEQGLRHEVLASSTPAVSIHAYAPALSEMTRYTLADGRLRGHGLIEGQVTP